jgi:tetratricopeptide (TPR) repeat protein
VPQVAQAEAFCGSGPTKTGAALFEQPMALQMQLGNSAAKLPGARGLEEQFYQMGWNHLHNFHYVDALRSFKVVISTNPSERAILALRIALMEHGDPVVSKNFLNLVKSKPLPKVAPISDVNTDAEAAEDEKLKNLFELYYQKQDYAQASKILATVKAEDFKAYFAFKMGQTEILSELYQKKPLSSVAHYLTHFNESFGNTAKAALFSRNYAHIAKNSAHAQHMYGHVLPLLGKWNEAIAQFRKADLLHKNWMKSNKATFSDDWHYNHNLDLLGASLMHTGDFSAANEAYLRKCEIKPFSVNCLSLIELQILRGDLSEARNTLHMYFMDVLPDQLDSKKTLKTVQAVKANALYYITLMQQNPQYDATIAKAVEDFIYDYRNTQSKNLGAAFEALLYVMELYKTDGAQEEVDLRLKISNFISEKLSAKGFDGWSHGAIAAQLVITSAEKFQLDLAARLRAELREKLKLQK